jgi:hypothetical protein
MVSGWSASFLTRTSRLPSMADGQEDGRTGGRAAGAHQPSRSSGAAVASGVLQSCGSD